MRRFGGDDRFSRRPRRPLAARPYSLLIDSTELHLRTDRRYIADLTDEVRSFCHGRGDGLCHLFAPHATAGLALMETGSRSEEDLEAAIGRLFPRDERYQHRHGSPGHGADHLLPVFVSPSLVLAVRAGHLVLGPWQSVVLVDPNRDNRERRVLLHFLSASG